jgi:(R,R)-butanediol dehydrogenase / meso-butanediol dehydrogenase / diacetyl reductase
VRAVVLADDRTLEVRDLDLPEPGEGQVRVRVAACGICGTDLHMRPSPAIQPGAVMGHELAGVVDAVGPGVSTVAEGDRVCVYPFRPLDHHDLESALTSGIGLGERPGAYAEALVVDADMCWELPEGLDLEMGALVEPLAVGLHGLDVGKVRRDDPCVVIGAGPIGVMTALSLTARGVENVVVVERNDARRERIASFGFETVGLDGVHEAAVAALGGLPRVVFECAGAPAAPNLAIELVAPSGTIVLLGVLDEPVSINQLLLMVKEAQMRASFAYRPANFTEALEMIATRRVPADRLVTGREPFERANEMFDELLRPETEHIKVLLRP